MQQRQEVGERIRRLRTALDLSQQRLGELAGLDRQTVGNYERARRAATIDELTSISAALGVEPWRLWHG